MKSLHPTSGCTSDRFRRSREGSVILAALFFAIVVSLVAVSFLKYAFGEMELEMRTHENARLLYEAEGGCDAAIWAINSGNWSGWKTGKLGNDMFWSATKSVDNRTDQHKIVVRNYKINPVIFSQAESLFGDGKKLTKQVRVRYNTGGGMGAGIIAKSKLIFKSHPTIDAYDSNVGPPSNHNLLDDVLVATTSSSDDALELKRSTEIYGYIGTGGGDPYINRLSTVTGDDTPVGTKVDTARISQDFTYDYPEVNQPDWTGALTTLNIPGHGTTQIGTPGTTVTRYSIDEIVMKGSTVVEVVGPVQIYLSKGMDLRGFAQIQILNNASLELYTPGDIKISGDGIANKTSTPSALRIFGTAPSLGMQDFSLSGSSTMEAVVYMPNADVLIDGNGVFSGSITGDSVMFDGDTSFHYDVRLSGTGVNDNGIASWHELVKTSDRMDVDSYIADVPVTP